MFVPTLFVTRLEVLFWESIMVAVKRIAGMTTTVTVLVTFLLIIVLATVI